MKRKPLHQPPREIREAEAMEPERRCGARNLVRDVKLGNSRGHWGGPDKVKVKRSY
ncbi:MAG: hypothetical protein JNK37_21210 [Verrucomicrobiales bacterium]|nr:hypothetical protein [Verrucomicrobiales bacterium]